MLSQVYDGRTPATHFTGDKDPLTRDLREDPCQRPPATSLRHHYCCTVNLLGRPLELQPKLSTGE